MAKIPRWLRVELFIGLAFLVGVLYSVVGEPFLIKVETPEIPAPRIGKVLGAKKIVFLSDLYAAAIGYREKTLVEEIEKIDPDIILIGAGLGTQNQTPLKSILNVLTHDRTVYAVLGPNDDTSKETVAMLEQEGVMILKDERVELPGEHGAIDLIGVNWPGSLPRLLEDPDDNRPKIILSSTPDIIAPIADAFLLEGSKKEDDTAADWRVSKGTWRFDQVNSFTIHESGPHRIRLQRAIGGLLIAELRLVSRGGATTVIEGKDIKEAGLRGSFQKLPGSAFGRQGMILDAGGVPGAVIAASLAPDDSAEITADLAAGTYDIEALVKTRGGLGAVWIQVEGSTNSKKQPRYQLGDNAAFPKNGDGVDLILCGGTQGGKARPLTFLEKVFFSKNHTDAYWNHLAGLYTIDDTPMYVTRGVGTTGLPVRLMAPPEITVLSFK